MGLNDLQILFQKPSKTYFSGETVYGQILINLNDTKKFRQIKVVLVGEGHVQWEETRTETRTDSDGKRHSETVTDYHRNHEAYTKQEIVVHNGPALPPGVHYFPFSFLLPPNLPSSFETAIGNVRYFIKADIVRDWKWNHKVKQHIMINGILDLNQYPSAKHEGNSRDHKRLCCLCCKSGPISAAIHTNRAGYVPGEMIGFGAEVDNQSTRVMQRSFLQLVETVSYRATTKTRTESRVVAELRRGEVLPGTSDYWEGVTMRVPAVPPTKLASTSCSIIDVQYQLAFHVEPSGIGFDLVVRLPIMVGTIPLQQYMPTLAPPPPPAFLPAPPSYQAPPTDKPAEAEPSAPPALDQFTMYPELPPPSYAESVWGVANVRHAEDEHTKGDWEFVPRYVTYNTQY